MKSIKTLIRTTVLAMLFIMSISFYASAANYYVTTTTVNLRTKASVYSSRIIELPPECVVDVTSTSNSKWYKVTYKNNAQTVFKGYIRSKYLEKAVQYKTTSQLNLRTYPNGPIVKKMPKGATIIVVNTYTGAWYKSVYFDSNGKVYRGYAYQNYLTKKGATKGTYVTTDSVYMHTEPSISSYSVTVIPKGKTINVTNISHGKWYYATYKTGSKTYKGYVSNLILKKK